MPQNLKLIGFLSVLLSCTSADAQVSFFGDLYIGGGKEVHVAFDETFFSGGQIKTERKGEKGILSFGKQSKWEQLEESSFVDGVVRIYHEGDFTFPVGEQTVFSPLSLFLKKNEGFVDVAYQNQIPLLYPTNNSTYEIPKYHFWSWESAGATEGTVQIHWTPKHQLQQLSYHHLDPNALHLGLLSLGYWNRIPAHFSKNLFFEDTPLSVDFGSVRILNPIDLSEFQGLTFLIEKEPSAALKLVSQIITPNGDGINDTWKISGYRFTERSRIFIYNHGRELVYHFEGLYQNDWDGSSENTGEILKQGSYFYTIDWEGDSRIDLEGWLYIKSN